MEHLEWIYNLILGSVVIGSLLVLHRQSEFELKIVRRLGMFCGGVALLLPLALVADSPFALIRLWCWGAFVHGVIWLCATAIIFRQSARWFTRVCTLFVILLIGIGVDAFLIEPFWLEITTYELKSPRISKKIRVALLADIQTDHITSWERSVLERMMEARPDLILIAGDTLQLRQESWTREREAFRRIWRETKVRAPLGVVVVGGNTDTDAWPTIYERLGVHIARQTQVIDLDSVVITGLSEMESFNTYAHVQRTDDRYHIVLGHSPDFALGHVDADLLVAGHTHGGQVQIPFLGPILTFSQIPRTWADGSTRLSDDQILIVSRGIGMERLDAPRIRFWCRPQLVFIDLIPALSD